MGNVQNGIQIKMLFGNVGDRFDGVSGPSVLRRGYQTQMTFGEMLPAKFWDGAEHRNSAVVLDAVAQFFFVSPVGNPVKDHGFDHDIRIKQRTSHDNRGHRTGDLCAINTQHHRTLEQLGKLCRTGAAYKIDAVKKTPVALDHRDTAIC